MWTPNRQDSFDGSFAETLNKSWNRQILGLAIAVAAYAGLLSFHSEGGNAAIIVIAVAAGFLAYQRRRSYEMYDLMFAKHPLNTSQRTVRAIRFGILAELALHGAAFLIAARSSFAG